MIEYSLRAKTAWRNALVAVALNLVGMPLELAVVRTIPQVPAWPALASMGAGLVLLALLIARRRTPSVALGSVVFLLNLAAIMTAVWVMNHGYPPSSAVEVPSQEYKLGMVTVAILAPQAWVGVVCITAQGIVSVVQLAMFAASGRDHLPIGEPWATIAYVLVAAVLLAYRVKQTALERDIALTRAKVEANEQLSHVLLAVRDLANTPLQTIAFAAETAREAHADVAPQMDRIDRSLGKLRTLEQRLHGPDYVPRWSRREESLDSTAVTTRRPR